MDIDEEEARSNQELNDLFHSPTPPPTTITEENNNNNNTEAVQSIEDDEEEEGNGLFGDDDEDEDEDAMEQDEPDDGLTREEREHRRKMEYAEDDAEGEIQENVDLTIAEIELANLGIPNSDRVWHARLPNFLSLNSEPFDESTWEPEVEEDSQTDLAEGNTKSAVLDENVIRWKWSVDENGNNVKESNSRIVRWSDGSLSLQIGSEIFDIASTVEPTIGPSSSTSNKNKNPNNPTSLSTFDTTRSHGLTYLTAAHDYSSLIEAQASIHGTMTFRPATTESNTHKKLAQSIAARNLKARAIKFLKVPEEDPEKKKLDQEKAEVDRLKQVKKDTLKSRSTGGGKKKRNATRFLGNSSDEDMEGEDGEEEDDDFESSAIGSRSQAKRGRGGPLNQEGEEEEEEDDDGFVVTDEEDGEGGNEKEGSADEMDETDKRIEREERRRKERKKEKKDDDAPVEPAQGVRRRLVIDDDEDEEEE